MRPRLPLAPLALVALAAAVLALTPTGAAQDGAVEVGTEPFDAEVDSHTYPVLSEDGEVVGAKPWRVVMDTGNCCEHYVTSTSEGRLVDFGGTYVRFSDDAGRTWHQVQLPEDAEIPTGEGAVVAGPGGDVFAVGWTPYGGDQLWAHRYVADEETWYYAPIPHHAPFYDRPWITALQGPFEAGTGETGFLTLVSGGFPLDRPFLVSEDGLSYTGATAEALASPGSAPATPDLPDGFEAEPTLARDFQQPHPGSEVAPAGPGLALGQPAGACPTGVVFTEERRWACNPNDLGSGWVIMDGAGTLHRTDVADDEGGFEYAVSHDGGDTWTTRDVTLPRNLTLEEHDVKAQATSGTSVVAVHARDPDAEADVDLAYRFRDVGCHPRLDDVLQVGNGDADMGRGVGSDTARFDFASLALLPGGRIAMSFADEAHRSSDEASGPGLAVERGAFPATPSDVPEAGNCAPEAAFSVTPLDPAPGTPVVLDAGASRDPDGDLVAHEWTFGDGASGSGERTTHAFDEPGTYEVTLAVEDGDGARDEATRTVVVRDPVAENEPPAPEIEVEQVDLRVAVDGSNTTDPDGTVAAHEWSFGDGVTAPGAVATHVYPGPGTYEVTLTAVDEAGASATASTEVVVAGGGSLTPQESGDAADALDVPAPAAGLSAVVLGAAAAGLRRV